VLDFFGLYDFGTNFVLPKLGVQKADQHSFKMVMVKLGMALAIDICAALCAYPLDTVRRNMMMMSGKKGSDLLFTSSVGAFSWILKNQGFGGLYRGAYMNSIRAVGSALVLVLYDEMKHHFVGNSSSKSH